MTLGARGDETRGVSRSFSATSFEMDASERFASGKVCTRTGSLFTCANSYLGIRMSGTHGRVHWLFGRSQDLHAFSSCTPADCK